jgi:two-component system, chemotaxis family, protein-glutamate methylesterase/glutaminase
MRESDPSDRVIVLGASAGGVESLSVLVAKLSPSLSAGVLVVLHMSAGAASVLAGILDASGPLPASFATERQTIGRGSILVAPPGRHLIIEDGHAVLSSGPRENGHRPAIDPLFRSAARSFRERAAGALLSGALDDGVLGLGAIKHAGGRAFVQDPDETMQPSMALNAISRVPLDGVLTLDEMARALTRFAEEPTELRAISINNRTGAEMQPRPDDGDDMDRLEREGRLTGFTCPACGGAIWEMERAGITSFRCHVGHAYGIESFAAEHADAVEQALWSAIRALQEKWKLLERLAESAREDGRGRSARMFSEQAADVRRRVETIRRLALAATTARSPSEALEAGQEELPA